jgi:hypothetical protein
MVEFWLLAFEMPIGFGDFHSVARVRSRRKRSPIQAFLSCGNGYSDSFLANGFAGQQTPGQMYSDLGFPVEAMGLEPTHLLTASHISGVREGSASTATGALPGTIVQSRSDPFSGIRPRCLHNCLHF